MYSLVPFQEFLNAVSIDGKRCSRYRAPNKGGSVEGCWGKNAVKGNTWQHYLAPFFCWCALALSWVRICCFINCSQTYLKVLKCTTQIDEIA